jgi:hypothetical protein
MSRALRTPENIRKLKWYPWLTPDRQAAMLSVVRDGADQLFRAGRDRPALGIAGVLPRKLTSKKPVFAALGRVRRRVSPRRCEE